MINICNNCTVNLTNITIDLYISRNCLIEKCSKGIKVSNKSTLNIKPGTTIKNNNISTKKDSGIKSAICSDNSKILLNGGNICDCDNTAICLMNNSLFEQYQGKIFNCDQAIYSCDSTIKQALATIYNCGCSKNGAAKASTTLYHPYGGAIYSKNSSIKQDYVNIFSCTANYGGAIYSREIYFPLKDNFIKLHDSRIANCSATSTDKIFCNPNKPIGGGAIYIDGFNPPKTKEADIKGSTITNCSSCRDGGAIIACGNSSLSLDNNSKIINCTSKNESTGKGNAIYTDYNVKLTIGNKCAIRFDDKCKINTNKDNSEQEYKHKGIFDKKIFLKLY